MRQHAQRPPRQRDGVTGAAANSAYRARVSYAITEGTKEPRGEVRSVADRLEIAIEYCTS